MSSNTSIALSTSSPSTTSSRMRGKRSPALGRRRATTAMSTIFLALAGLTFGDALRSQTELRTILVGLVEMMIADLGDNFAEAEELHMLVHRNDLGPRTKALASRAAQHGWSDDVIQAVTSRLKSVCAILKTKA